MNNKKIYGLIGWPVKHSLSPLMQMAAFNALDINADYRLFEIEPEKLEEFLLKEIEVLDTEGKVFSTKEIAGFNITIPHKVMAKEILEREFPFREYESLSSENLYYVKASGAINTVNRIDEKVDYYNTDATGFLKSLREDLGFDPKDKNVLIIGCGGAGRAIIAALSWKKHSVKKIYIYDISEVALESCKIHFSQLEHIYEKIEFINKDEISHKLKECQLLVNASFTGMRENDPPVINKNFLHDDLSIYDIIYHRDTQLIKDAKSKRLPAKGGLGMLLYQGVDAFRLWTNQEPPAEEMRKALQIQIGGDK